MMPESATVVETPKSETVLTPATPPAEVKAAPPVVEKPVEPVKPVEIDYSKIELPKESKLTAADKTAAIAQAKKEGRSAEVVQLLLNERDAAIKSYETAEVARIKGESDKWLAELKADKEIGGDAFPKNIENAKRVIDKYAGEDFKNFLNDSGLGNHPMLVKMFSKLGKAFGEDHWKDGNPVVPKKERKPEEVMYDKTT